MTPALHDLIVQEYAEITAVGLKRAELTVVVQDQRAVQRCAEATVRRVRAAPVKAQIKA